MNAGSVYAIGIEGTPRVKIGWARNVAWRLQELQTGMPHRLGILHMRWEEEARRIAHLSHDLLRPVRRHGEWFDVAPEVLQMRWQYPKAQLFALSATGNRDALAIDAPCAALWKT